MNDFSNLMSGLIGAVVGVLLAVVLARFAFALRLNGIRNFLRFYLSTIAQDKLQKYVTDVGNALKEIHGHELHPDFMKQGYDMMPMLTSEVFKSITNEDMARVMYNQKNLTDIIDFYYSVDFLKDHMPITYFREYVTKLEQHYAEKNLKTNTERALHDLECPFIKHEREYKSADLQLKEQTANECITLCSNLVKNLKGRGLWWILKYTLKF